VSALLRGALEPVLSAHAGLHNYTLSLAAAADRFHQLTWAGCSVVRTLDPSRLLVALARHLGNHGAPAVGVLRLDAPAVVRDGVAHMLPSRLAPALPRYEAHLRTRGFTVVDGPWSDVDPSAGELVVTSPASLSGLLDGLVDLAPPVRRPDASVADGRYPIADWTFVTFGPADGGPTRAEAVAHVLAKPVPGLGVRAWPGLARDLGELFNSTPARWAPTDSPASFAAWLAERW
jgi:hypothetical protein